MLCIPAVLASSQGNCDPRYTMSPYYKHGRNLVKGISHLYPDSKARGLRNVMQPVSQRA